MVASQSTTNPMDLIKAAQEAAQKAISTVHKDKDILKQAKKDAEENHKAAMKELKKQQKNELAALDVAQTATPPTVPKFSDMTISQLQAQGMDISDMTIKKASLAVDQKKKQGLGGNKSKGKEAQISSINACMQLCAHASAIKLKKILALKV